MMGMRTTVLVAEEMTMTMGVKAEVQTEETAMTDQAENVAEEAADVTTLRTMTVEATDSAMAMDSMEKQTK